MEKWLEELCIKHSCWTWLEKICEKYGNFNWPPYPKELIFPEWITKEGCRYGRFKNKIFPILRIRESIYEISKGDQFNTIIKPKKRKKGLKASESYHRVFQLTPKIRKRGRIVYIDSISGAETLKKGEVMKNRVYRVEIVKIKKEIFDCVALAHTFNKDNLIENLIYCNYQRYEKSKNPTNLTSKLLRT